MNTVQRRISLLGALLPLALGAAACNDAATGPTGAPMVSIGFATVPASASQPAYAPMANHTGDGLVIEGSNGTLELTGLFLIVSEFELDRVGQSCDDVVDEDACEKFEAPPSFVQVPLTGETALAVNQDIPPGTYTELDFEVEDVEVDDTDGDDNSKSAEIQALLLQIREQFADWPGKAAALVTGTFTPTGGEPVAFRTYLEAEIEIEMAFDPPLEITETSADKRITVEIDPAAWFTFEDGTVLDLSAYDYDATQAVYEFEFEMEHGFTEIEHEDDNHDGG